jgi:hypothetical protein
MSTQLELDWTPPACRIIAFPLVNRVGRIREVAAKLSTKSKAGADFYMRQVSEGLFVQLDRVGVPEHAQDEQIGAFWSAVEIEVARLTYRGQRPGGDAA